MERRGAIGIGEPDTQARATRSGANDFSNRQILDLGHGLGLGAGLAYQVGNQRGSIVSAWAAVPNRTSADSTNPAMIELIFKRKLRRSGKTNAQARARH